MRCWLRIIVAIGARRRRILAADGPPVVTAARDSRSIRAAEEGGAEIAAHRLAVLQCMLALCQAMVETKPDVRIAR
jgi:hypothetical protein